jgi:ATP-binding cassette subfamily F protein 3
VLWLENYLQTRFEKTLIIVSHDRSFLNNVITDTVHAYQKQLNYYRGNYVSVHSRAHHLARAGIELVGIEQNLGPTLFVY